MLNTRRCCDCRDGEHDNYDEDVRMTVVRDPDNGQLAKRGYLCEGHRTMYADDSYDVEF